METVFQHNITREEKEAIGISYEESKYVDFFGKNTALWDLAFLFSHRKDMKKAEFYANQLPDQDKLNCLRTIYHP